MSLITFSLDDAMKNQHRNGLPAMIEFGFRGTLGVVTGRVGQSYNHTPEWQVKAMTWKEIRDFHTAGWEIASHSRDHRSVSNILLQGPYPQLTEIELWNEVVGSKQDLEERGYAPTTFIRPGSLFQNPLTIAEAELVRTHYQGRRLYYSGIYTPKKPLLNSTVFPLPYDLMAVHLISYPDLEKDLKAMLDRLPEESWVIFCVHGIDEPLGGSTTITPRDFTRALELVQERGFSVVTIEEGLNLCS